MTRPIVNEPIGRRMRRVHWPFSLVSALYVAFIGYHVVMFVAKHGPAKVGAFLRDALTR